MKSLKVKVQVEQMSEGGWYASIHEYRLSMGIKGCPLGRGSSVERAIKDLIYRVRIESNVHLDVIGKVYY